jgi:hypothetical protein
VDTDGSGGGFAQFRQAEGDTLQANVPEVTGEHAAGQAHTDQMQAPTSVDDGNVSPQGDFTGDEVSAQDNTVPDLESGQGDHGAGPAHSDQMADSGDAPPTGFTGDEVSAEDNEVPDLEAGQGEHAAGEAHTTGIDVDAAAQESAAAGASEAVGMMLSQQIDTDSTGEELLANTATSTVQSNVGAALDGQASTEAFSNVGAQAGSSLVGAGAGLVAGEVTGELGLNGGSFGDQVGAAMVSQGVSTTASAGYQAAVNGADAAASAAASGVSSIATAGAGAVGAYAASEIGLGADTEMGATLSAVGSTVGATFGGAIGSVIPVVGTYVGTAIGSFLGSTIGSALGDLLGGSSEPPPPPQAHAEAAFSDGEFEITDTGDAHGGNGGGLMLAVEGAGDTIEGVLEAIGGRFVAPDELGEMTLRTNAREGIFANGERVDSIEAGVETLVRDALQGQAIEGGDVYVKRAVYRAVEGDDFSISALKDAVATGQRYSEAQQAQARAEALAEDPDVAEELKQLAAGAISADDLSDAAALAARYDADASTTEVASPDADTVTTGAGEQTLVGLGGADTLSAGADTLDGGAGTDTADYGAAEGAVAVDLAAGEGHGASAEGDTLIDIDNVTGGLHGDTLVGDAEANRLDGGAGEDRLTGRVSIDALYGVSGDDVLVGGPGAGQAVSQTRRPTCVAANRPVNLTMDRGRPRHRYGSRAPYHSPPAHRTRARRAPPRDRSRALCSQGRAPLVRALTPVGNERLAASAPQATSQSANAHACAAPREAPCVVRAQVV